MNKIIKTLLLFFIISLFISTVNASTSVTIDTFESADYGTRTTDGKLGNLFSSIWDYFEIGDTGTDSQVDTTSNDCIGNQGARFTNLDDSETLGIQTELIINTSTFLSISTNLDEGDTIQYFRSAGASRDFGVQLLESDNVTGLLFIDKAYSGGITEETWTITQDDITSALVSQDFNAFSLFVADIEDDSFTSTFGCIDQVTVEFDVVSDDAREPFFTGCGTNNVLCITDFEGTIINGTSIDSDILNIIVSVDDTHSHVEGNEVKAFITGFESTLFNNTPTFNSGVCENIDGGHSSHNNCTYNFSIDISSLTSGQQFTVDFNFTDHFFDFTSDESNSTQEFHRIRNSGTSDNQDEEFLLWFTKTSPPTEITTTVFIPPIDQIFDNTQTQFLSHIYTTTNDIDLVSVDYFIDNTLIKSSSSSGSAINDYFIVTLIGLSIGDHDFIVEAISDDASLNTTVNFSISEFVNIVPNIEVFRPLVNEIVDDLKIDFILFDDTNFLDEFTLLIDGNIILRENISEFTFTPRTFKTFALSFTNELANNLFGGGNHTLDISITDDLGAINTSVIPFYISQGSNIEIVEPIQTNFQIGDTFSIIYIIENNIDFSNITIENNGIELIFSENFQEANIFIINTSHWSIGRNDLTFIARKTTGDITSNNFVYTVGDKPKIVIHVVNGFNNIPIENVRVDVFIQNTLEFVNASLTNVNGIVEFPIDSSLIGFGPAFSSLSIVFSKGGFVTHQIELNPQDFFVNKIEVSLYKDPSFSGITSVNFRTFDENGIEITSTINLLSKTNDSRNAEFNSNTNVDLFNDDYYININSSGYETLYSEITIFENRTTNPFRYNLNLIPTDRPIISFNVRDDITLENIERVKVTFIQVENGGIGFKTVILSQFLSVTFYPINDTQYDILIEKQGYESRLISNVNLTILTGIPLYFHIRKLTFEDFIDVTMRLFDVNNDVIIEQIQYSIFNKRTGSVVANSFFNVFDLSGQQIVTLMKGENYSFTLGNENYTKKTFTDFFNGDTFLKIVLFREGFVGVLPILETEDTGEVTNIIDDSIRDFRNFLIFITAGNVLIFSVLIILGVVFLMNKYEVKEKMQLIVTALVFFMLISFGLIPSHIGILMIITIGLLFGNKFNDLVNSGNPD